MRFPIIFIFAITTLLSCAYDRNIDYDFPTNEKYNINNQHLAALSILSDDIKNNPSDPSSYFKRALLHLKIDNFEDALVDISRAEKLNPNSGEYLFYKANIQNILGKKEALSNALAAESQNYDLPDLYVLIADLYLKANQKVKSKEYLEKAERIYPYLSDLFLVRGRYNAKSGDTITAIHNFKKAIKLKPHSFQAYDDLIKIYSSYKWIDSSLAINNLAISKFPEKRELIFNKALILEKAGSLENARQAYLYFFKIDPTRFDVLERVGDIYIRKRQYDDARMIYLKWSKLDPEKIMPLRKISDCFRNQADYYNAKKYIDLALKIEPENNILKIESKYFENKINQQTDYYSDYKTAEIKNEIEEQTETQESGRRIFGGNLGNIETIQKMNPIKIGKDTTRN